MMYRFSYWFIGVCVVAIMVQPIVGVHIARAQDVEVTGHVLSTRVAPGEELPFSLTLLNFGASRRADVVITYRVLDENDVAVYSQKETVAVDTTASVIRYMPIPPHLAPGTYSLESDIAYPYQTAPAVSHFTFSVEQKLFGMYYSDLIRNGSVAGASAVTGIMAAWFLLHRRQHRIFPSHDYSDKPRSERVYYEILSEVIAQMRVHAGDQALELAARVPHLQVDSDTGKVLAITKDPAVVVQNLVMRYETQLGRNVHLEDVSPSH